MKSTNFVLSLIFIFSLLLLISGCTEKDSPTAPPENSFSIEDYFLSPEGITKYYAGYNSGDPCLHETIEVVEQEYFEGKNSWIIESRYQRFNGDNSIYGESIGHYSVENDSLFYCFDTEWIKYKSLSGLFGLEIGDTIRYDDDIQPGPIPNGYVVLESFDAICVVNDSTFNNCIQIKMPYSAYGYTTRYYSRGIGLVYSKTDIVNTHEQYPLAFEKKLISYSERSTVYSADFNIYY